MSDSIARNTIRTAQSPAARLGAVSRDKLHRLTQAARGSSVRWGAKLREYIVRLSQTRFWISKWFVAAVVSVGALLIGIALLITSNIDLDTFLSYFALGLLLFVLVTLFYGIIAIHDVPYEIAKHRNHPHQDAIHAAGWVSLFTLHVLWPFLWIWAMLYRPDRGWGMGTAPGTQGLQSDLVEQLSRRVADLENRLEPRAR